MDQCRHSLLSRAALSALLFASASAWAEAPAERASPSASSPATNTTSAVKSGPDFEAMLRAIDKIFPPQPDPDPVRFALAQTAVQPMWPNGAYAKMMAGFVDSLFNGAMTMKKADLTPVAPSVKKSGSRSADKAMGERPAANDPNFDQRMAAIRGIVDDEIGKISIVIDPRMRDGLARSMARRFDARQLTDINAFFATPSGHAFAAEYMQLWFEPDTFRSMVTAFPEMMKLMPDATQRLKAVNEKFPKPRPPVSEVTKH